MHRKRLKVDGNKQKEKLRMGMSIQMAVIKMHLKSGRKENRSK